MKFLKWKTGIFIFLLLGGFPLLGLSMNSAEMAKTRSGTIEIQIRNSIFEYHGGVLKPNQPATIFLKNLDSIPHGFISPSLEEMVVEVESKSGTTLGKGITRIHINPGQELQIHFLPTKPGSFSFQCDIHPKMKGELLSISIDVI